MPSPLVTIIQLDPAATAGRLTDWLDDVEPRLVHAWDGDPVPDPADVGDGLVVLGGALGVHDVNAPWLAATRDLLAGAVARETPTLAIGLGFQLLVAATGGRVAVAAPPGHEAGLVTIKARPGVVDDPLLRALFDGRREIRQPAMHADAVVELPEGAAWLAQSRMYPFQAARIGSALGLQFHPEIDDAELEAWAAREGVDADPIRAQLAEHGEESSAAGGRLVAAFAAGLWVGAGVPVG